MHQKLFVSQAHSAAPDSLRWNSRIGKAHIGRERKRNRRKDNRQVDGKEGKRDKVPYPHFFFQLPALATAYIQLMLYKLFYTDADTFMLSQLTIRM